jgi:hypothetical protein
LVTIEDEAELANTQARLKGQVEEFLKPFGQTKVEHLFSTSKGAVSSDQLKTYVEEHPEIIFDYLLVNYI